MSSSLQSRLRGLVGASKKEKGSSSSKSKSSLSGGSSDPGALNSQSSHHQRSPSHSSLSATGTNTTASTPPSESHSSLADDAVADPTASSSSSPATAAAALPLTDSDAHHGSEDNAPGDDENPPAHLRAVSPSSGAAELDNGGSWTPPDATHGSAALLDTSTAPSADTAEPKGSKHSGSGGKGHGHGGGGKLAKWREKSEKWMNKAADKAAEYRQGGSSTSAAADGHGKRDHHHNNHHSHHHGGSSTSPHVPRVFGVPIASAVAASQIDTTCPLPAVVIRAIEFLEGRGMDEVGLYRIPGSTTAVAKLKAAYDSGADLDLFLEDPPLDPHAVATLFKLYMRELPEPLLGDYTAHFAHIAATSPRPVPHLAALARQLPLPNYYMMSWLTAHLARLAYYADVNKMTLNNLALIFCPTLQLDSSLFTMLVRNSVHVFPLSENGEVPDEVYQGETVGEEDVVTVVVAVEAMLVPREDGDDIDDEEVAAMAAAVPGDSEADDDIDDRRIHGSVTPELLADVRADRSRNRALHQVPSSDSLTATPAAGGVMAAAAAATPLAVTLPGSRDASPQRPAASNSDHPPASPTRSNPSRAGSPPVQGASPVPTPAATVAPAVADVAPAAPYLSVGDMGFGGGLDIDLLGLGLGPASSPPPPPPALLAMAAGQVASAALAPSTTTAAADAAATKVGTSASSPSSDRGRSTTSGGDEINVGSSSGRSRSVTPSKQQPLPVPSAPRDLLDDDVSPLAPAAPLASVPVDPFADPV